jgi:hypothetical protein
MSARPDALWGWRLSRFVSGFVTILSSSQWREPPDFDPRLFEIHNGGQSFTPARSLIAVVEASYDFFVSNKRNRQSASPSLNRSNLLATEAGGPSWKHGRRPRSEDYNKIDLQGAALPARLTGRPEKNAWGFVDFLCTSLFCIRFLVSGVSIDP